MKKHLLPSAVILLLAGLVAFAQDIANHAVPIGGGPGAVGWKQAVPGTAGQVLTSTGAASDPTFQSGSAVLDVVCATNNTSLYRTAGTWGCLTGTSGGIPYFNSATTFTSSGTLTANALVLGGGAGGSPTVVGSLGTTTTLLHGNAAGAPSFGAVVTNDIANNAVDNTKLAQMAANTAKCNPTTSTANATDCKFPTINANDAAYGAVCNGTGDDSTAFNNAIAALPVTGGVVEFSGNCRVTNPIIIGNGTNAAASTRYGVYLRGIGIVGNPVFPGYTASAGPKITYAGSGVSGVIQVNGPLQGYGIQNVQIDCGSVASTFGINVTSASYGDNRNVVLQNCIRGIVSTTHALFGSFTNTDSIHTSWYNVTVNIPATAGSMGILLTGTASGNSNTDYNNFYNTHISGPTSAVAVTGILLQSTDTVHFYQTHLSGFNASATCIQMDYSVANSFPSTTRFIGLDTGNNCNGGAAYAVNGTPGAAAKANHFYIDGANNTVCPATSVVNTTCISNNQFITNPNGNNAGSDILGAWVSYTPSPTCGTATFTVATAKRMIMGKTTHVQANFTINALGTCTTNLTFNLPNTTNSTGGLAGRDTATGNAVNCYVGNAATTAVCGRTTNANFAAGDNILLSGVYENQ